MAVKASPETIREMKKDISNTIRDIERISSGIKSGMSATSNWDDAQIARLTATPIDTLNAALPKLEKLAQSLDQYNKVKF